MSGEGMLRVFKSYGPLWTVFELVADGAIVFLSIVIAGARIPASALTHLPAPVLRPDLLMPAAAIVSLVLLLYCAAGVYQTGTARLNLQTMVARGLLALLAASAAASLVLRANGSDDFAVTMLLYAVPIMAVGLVLTRSLAWWAERASLATKRVLIVGTGKEAHLVAARLRSDTAHPHIVVGFYPAGVEPVAIGPGRDDFAGRSVDEVAAALHVDEVIVAVREQRDGGVPMTQLLACRIRGIPVLDLTAFYERARGEVLIDSLRSSSLIYGHGGFNQLGARAFVKRIVDILLSLVLLIITLPVSIVAACAIRLETRGPLMYSQERVGFGGRSFMCTKFRSMCIDAEKDGIARWASANDPRVTRVGAFIRKCRIDELPQLISVLKGDMSLVGPRPERPAFVRQLSSQIPFYDIRHSVKPGITGWAQVRYSYGASLEDARRKHQFDLYYVKNHSLLLDLLVVVETISVVLFREGAR